MSSIKAIKKEANGVTNSPLFPQRTEIQEVTNVGGEYDSSSSSFQSNSTTDSEKEEKYQTQLTPVPISQLLASGSEANVSNFSQGMENQQVIIILHTPADVLFLNTVAYTYKFKYMLL